jgi:hypothetical protein
MVQMNNNNTKRKPTPTSETNVCRVNQDNGHELTKLEQIWKEIGLSSSLSDDEYIVNNNFLTDDQTSSTNPTTSVWRPLLAFGFGSAVLINIGVLCSLPPVLCGRGMLY